MRTTGPPNDTSPARLLHGTGTGQTMEASRAAAAIRAGYPRIISSYAVGGDVWRRRVSMLKRDGISIPGLFRRIVRASYHCDAMILNGSIGLREGYVDLLAAAAISHRPSGPSIVIADCSWKLGDLRLDRIACRAGLRAIDSPKVVYCVHSSEERLAFASKWRVPIDLERIVVAPFGHTLSDEDLALAISDDGGVFAGGDSYRDYGPLLSIAGSLPVPMTIATNGELPPAPRPENVSVVQVDRAGFFARTRRAAVVVVPLAAALDRASGQFAYLNAMAMGKLVVVTESPGVRDYIEDGVTGLVVPPSDPAALSRVVSWALAPENRDRVREIGRKAAQVARTRFNQDTYAHHLIQAVDRAIDRCRDVAAVRR
jgi:hypothetical protein